MRIHWLPTLVVYLTCMTAVHAADSLLRIACDEDAAGAEVSINGKFKGECPIDLSLPEGTHQISALKKIDDEKFRTFNQTMRLGDGVVKRIDIQLGAPQLTTLGQQREAERQRQAAERKRQEEVRQAELRRQEQERQRLAEEEARRREAERQAQLAEQLRIHLIKEEENSRALAQFAKRGITPGSGKSFKDCDSCPDMVLIPAGKFVMGSRHGAASEQPEHEVKISYPLAVAKTEITQTQFKAVMGRNPSHFQAMSDDLPVENVSWQDAQEYVKQLSSMTGHTYRLLSEAEWEYACRAGGRHEYCGSADIERASWYSFNSGRKTHVVATKAPNAWGLYDMSGNVWEWVQDCTGNYSSTPSDGTAWTSGNCVERMVRGGSYVDVPRSTRAAVRDWFGVSSRGSSLGFRPARIISP